MNDVQSSSSKRERLLTALACVTAAVGILATYGFSEEVQLNVLQRALIIVPVAYCVASILSFKRLRRAHLIAVCAGTIALAIAFWNEWARSPWVNSWIALNVPDNSHWDRNLPLTAGCNIITVAVIIALTVVSAIRLLPGNWPLRGKAIRQRTWPGLAIPLIILPVWFLCCITPYRLPGIVDRIGTDITILHVVKRGIHFREVVVSATSHGSLGRRLTNRSLFQRKFRTESGMTEMPTALTERVIALTKTQWPIEAEKDVSPRLKGWNAEGWYIRTGTHFVFFTSDRGTAPPTEVVDVFHDLEREPIPIDSIFEYKDICFGFCYDELSALGLMYANERCGGSESGKSGIVCR